MLQSWDDLVASAENSAPATATPTEADFSIHSSTGPTPNSAVVPAPNSNAGTTSNQRPTRSAYVPPHLRNRSAAPEPSPAVTPAPQSHSHTPSLGSNVAPSREAPRPAYGTSVSRPLSGGGGGGGWNARSGGGGWDNRRDREPNPFANDSPVDPVTFEDQENSGINFDAYEDIPVDATGENIPPSVATFAEIDLGNALNENIRRCRYVKPTPIQRHSIPIALAGRDLMACAQTGSGKTAAFCFPIISGIMSNGPPPQRPRGTRTAYPLALILSPTRELSAQVCSSASEADFLSALNCLNFFFLPFCVVEESWSLMFYVHSIYSTMLGSHGCFYMHLRLLKTLM
jgi:ATP-dependent RNA helicase DDX3X